MMLLYRESKTISCKYCGTHEVVKYGSYKGTPRYLCKLCGRKFKDDDHVFHMRVPAAYIHCVLNLYYEGMRINNIRNILRQNFGYYPSATLIQFWINKYTNEAEQALKNCQPQVGDTWIADEMKIRLSGKKFFLYDVVDEKTDYLLTLYITRTRTTDAVRTLIQRASEVAGRMPELVMVYIPYSFFNSMEKGSGYVIEQVPRETFADRNRIGILSSNNIYRIRNLNSLRTTKQAEKFFKGLSLHYNYFEPNEKPEGKTPAEAARINYPCHSWKDLIEPSAGLRTRLTRPSKRSPAIVLGWNSERENERSERDIRRSIVSVS